MPLPKSVEEAGRKADELHARAYKPQAPATPAPAPQANASGTPAPQPDPPVVEDAAYWKNRFEVVQGKYNAEVPRLAEQVRGSKEVVEKLESRVNELTTRPAAPAPEVFAPPVA